MLSLRRSTRIAVAAAGSVLTLHGGSSSNNSSEPSVIGAVVLFRHGARSAIFHLPDGPSVRYETITAAPPHAVRASVQNGKNCHKYAPPSAPGFLTPLGWKQGEALGRQMRKRYGDAATVSATHSTDTSRTVLTAHAVLTGFLEESASRPSSMPQTLNAYGPSIVSINVIRGATLALDIGCAELALHLNAGRAKFRETDTANSQARAALRDAFGENYRPSQCGLLAVHDDCVARHVHGLPPSESVDMSLCELSSRETAREVRAAMRHTEVNDDTRRTNAYAARLAAGRLMQIIGAHISECRAAPPGPGEGPRLLLLSGHDTSLMAVANALEHLASDAPPSGPLLPDDVWPPHTASIAIELLSDGSVRIVYEWEELTATQPLERFLRGVKRLGSTESQHALFCGESDEDGASFRWSD